MIKFGPSGNDKNFYAAGYTSTTEAPKWLSELGLNAFEYSFGKGILLQDAKATEIGNEMKKYGISISVHAPYFINFANTDDEMIEKSYGYVLRSLAKLRVLGGNRCVIHIGSCGKLERAEALRLIKEKVKILVQKVKDAGYSDMLLCIETMGKQSQIGTFKEIVDICTIDDILIPTFDFGHINAVTLGSLKTKEDYEEIFDYCLEKLGEYRTKNVHIHFSKIEYGPKGEIKHLTMDDTIYGPEFEPLALILKERNYTPVIICESKDVMAMDSIKLRDIYNSIKLK